ncbi:MAG: NAD(P)-dependent alcohol dehydrogenase [Rhodospirillaceae bacterium]|nr:MAG: NAD(P)-dependent alcohol dehydrogenase [Rhodospirillaceae bacterium]
MRAFTLCPPKGLDGLTMHEMPSPGPLGPGQVRIAMRAASLNFRDLMIATGPSKQDTIPVSDGAGEIAEVAPDVRRVRVGDRVALAFNPDWIGGEWRPSPGAAGRGGATPGVMREEIVAHESEVVTLPSHLSFEEGAALPCAGVTAWHSLCGGAARLLPGMTVLLQGGGGVSLFALQFAKLFGARVIMISSSPERCARLKSMGADETIDYRAEPAWETAVRKLTGGMGVDLTVEVGGAETVDRSFASTRMGGRVALVGLLTGLPKLSTSMIASMVDVTPVKVGSRQDFEDMNRAIAFHKLRPVIDSRYDFEKLPDAMRHLQSGRHFGKIVIVFK